MSLYKTRCRICDNLLFVSASMSHETLGGLVGGIAVVELERDETGYSFRCCYCFARNVLLRTNAADGATPIQVAWAVLNGD